MTGKLRWWIGYRRTDGRPEPFQSDPAPYVPTAEDVGHIYGSVSGPWTTARQAETECTRRLRAWTPL